MTIVIAIIAAPFIIGYVASMREASDISTTVAKVENATARLLAGEVVEIVT